MKNRFKLTTGFLVASVVIFAVAAFVITKSAERNEKANLVNVISQQSSRDAQVIAGVLTGVLGSSEAASDSGFASPSDSGNYESLAMTTFLRTSNIVRLSLLDVDGSKIWSSVETESKQMAPSNSAFNSALEGTTSTGLERGAEFVALNGAATTGDIVSTYIPLLDTATRQPSQILEVTRDVTGTLDARIETAKSSMFTTVFSTLGGAFFILFGVVLSADMLISRSRNRAITQERALADEKIVASTLELENQQLRQLNEERDRFLSMVSHELRTPLTTIMGFTDVLRRRQDGDRKESNLKHLDVMRRNGDHLNSLIEEMLEITRIQAGKFEVVKEGFMMDRLLEQVEASGKILLTPRRQKLVIVKRIDKMELHGDQRRVLQVLLNLLSNASKYSPTDTTITLTVEQIGTTVKISVNDEGNGIPEDECELLFERFYRRDDETTRSQSGLGLGLSIVKAIVDAHHGEVVVQSTVGVGTTMSVSFPGARLVGAVTAAISNRVTEQEMKHLKRMRDLRTAATMQTAS